MEVNKLDCRELMIGNLVKLQYEDFDRYSIGSQINHKNNIFIVEKIHEDEIWTYNSLENFHHTDLIEEYEPIPLTEDILIKCGYTELDFERGRVIFTDDDSGCYIRSLSNSKITYLHELQNTYYWNTKQNLEIKL